MHNGIFFGALLLFALLVRPYPLDLIGATGARAIDAAVTLGLVGYVALVVMQRGLRFNRHAALVSVILAAMSLLSLGAAIYGMARGVSNLDARDVFDSMRYVQFAALIAFGYALGCDRRFSAGLFLRIVLVVGFASFGFGLLQKLAPGPTYFLTQLYTPEHQGARIFTTQRVTSFYGNPNTAALMTTVFAMYVLAYLAGRKGALAASQQRVLAGCVVSFLLFVVLCGSRTGLLAFVAGVLVYLAATRPPWRWMLSIALVASVLVLFRDPILQQVRAVNAYLYAGLVLMLSGDWHALTSAGSTLFARFARWQEALELYRMSPWIGLGPLRGVVTSATDNFYLYVLLRMGVLGLLLYFTLLAAVLTLAIREIRARRGIFGYFLLLATTVILVANVTLEAQILISMTYLYFPAVGILAARAGTSPHPERVPAGRYRASAVLEGA
jgi:O-antigen ligase